MTNEELWGVESFKKNLEIFYILESNAARF